MNGPAGQGKNFEIVRHLSKPLQVAGLGLLVINAIVAISGLALRDKGLVYFAISATMLLVLVVLLLGRFYPEALEGVRRLSENYSNLFGDKLWSALAGYLNNLSAAEQKEALGVLVTSLRMEESAQADGDYRKFCNGVSEYLKSKQSIYVTIRQGRVRRARR
jgi:hypothetical protein